MELESQIEDLHSNQSALSSQEDSELKQKINSFIKKHKETDAELQSCSVTIESLESQIEASGVVLTVMICMLKIKEELVFS